MAPRHWRRAVAVALLLGPVGALRQPHPPSAPSRRALPRAALLLAVAGPRASGQVSQLTSDMFNFRDTNGDGRLTKEEYAGSQDVLQWVSRSTLFIQADLDDDDVLSVAEYQFANYLTHQAHIEAKLKEGAPWVPEGFREAIDDVFHQLREASMGSTAFGDLLVAFHGALVDETPDEHSKQRMRLLFDCADVTGDGTLNLNELDFMHFMVRDVMVEAIMVANIVGWYGDVPDDIDYDEAFKKVLVDALELVDVNQDGSLTLEELADGAHLVFADTPEEESFYTRRVRSSCHQFDKDSDGILDKSEVHEFVVDLLKWRAK